MFLAILKKFAFRNLMDRLRGLRNRHVFLLDVLVVGVAPAAALLIRLEEFAALQVYSGALIGFTLLMLATWGLVFVRFGLYRRYWRYASVDDLLQISLAVLVAALLATGAFAICLNLGFWDPPLPRSVPLIAALLGLLMVGGNRFSVRLAEQLRRERPNGNVRRVLIVGAGQAGQMIVRELQANPELGMVPVGFLDDDCFKQGAQIASLRVLGGSEDLPDVVERHKVTEVIIAMPRAPGKAIRAVRLLCEAAGVPVRTAPGMYEILGGSVSVNQLRQVQIEDLLRREPVQTDIAAVRELVRGKRVLITGAGGSIGGELCRQVLRCAPAELALLGHGEHSVFEACNELERLLRKRATAGNGGEPETALHAFIADIRFPERLRSIITRFRPQIIFHAAAHKHVPLMESNAADAIANNVFGTRVLLDAALKAGVERFVMISTDKAVKPTSVMGSSKRLAELLVLGAARRSGKPYVAVRFGNVLGSRGSVVLTFKQQIAAGGPVTVSHPDMQRYFMTIPEAVQLVLQASVLGRGGETFVLDMGEPVKVVDLARDLIQLSGLTLGRDIDLVYTGIRPGEKLFEELRIEGEEYQPTQHEKVLIARNAGSFVPERLDQGLVDLERAVAEDDREAIVRCLQELIPEYHPEDQGIPATAAALKGAVPGTRRGKPAPPSMPLPPPEAASPPPPAAPPG